MPFTSNICINGDVNLREINYWKLESMQVQIEVLSSAPIIPSIFEVSIEFFFLGRGELVQINVWIGKCCVLEEICNGKINAAYLQNGEVGVIYIVLCGHMLK